MSKIDRWVDMLPEGAHPGHWLAQIQMSGLWWDVFCSWLPRIIQLKKRQTHKSHASKEVHKKHFKNNIPFAFSFFLRKVRGTGSNFLAETAKIR